MQRSLGTLAAERHDLLVVGGGIAGAWVAWEAALSGLKVALIEKGDFCGATSGNSSTIPPGGLRYLQQADIPRMRHSIQERRTLLKVAPHLTRPLPCVVPTHGAWTHSRAVLRAGLLLTDSIGLDRNRGLPTRRRLNAGRLLDRDELALAAPGIDLDEMTGGALWDDAQVTAPARLVLAVLRSASERGASVANYVEALTPAQTETRDGQQVTGVQARDQLTGRRFEIDARVVVDATGPWAGRLAARIPGLGEQHLPPLCAGMNLVVRRPGIDRGPYRDAAWGGLIHPEGGSARFLFAVPWQDQVIFGTRYAAYTETPDRLTVAAEDVDALLDSIAEAFPRLRVQREDIIRIHAGVLPAEAPVASGMEPTPIRRHRLIEHHKTDRVGGIVTVVTEKLTTARHVAEEVVGRVLSSLGRTASTGASARMPVTGGDIDDMEQFLDEAVNHPQLTNVSRETARGFAGHYGSEFERVLEHLPDSPQLPDESALFCAGASFAVQHEMAESLSDVALRRVYLGPGGAPPDEVLEILAHRMGQDRSWDDERMAAELASLQTKPLKEKE